MNNCEKKEAEIKGCLYFTISSLFRNLNRIAEDAFRKIDICPTHGFLMILLQEDEEGLSVNKISEILSIAPSTVTRFVDKLVARGYVERVKVGKQSFTKMTKEGKKVMPQVYSCWNDLISRIKSLVGDEGYLTEMSDRFSSFATLFDDKQKYIK